MKKAKKIRRLLAGLLILAVLGTVLVLLRMRGGEETVRETLTGHTVDQLKTVSYKKTGGEEVSFTREQGLWITDSNISVDQTKAGTLAASLTGIGITRELPDTGDLTVFGLSEPSYEVRLTDRDGETTEILIGDTNEMTGDVYILKDGRVYAASPGILTGLDRDLSYYEEEPTSSAAEAVADEAESALES